MFPVSFEYLKVHSAEEALAALQQHGGDARVLAGGQSLIPAMRYRLARPAFLVDIGGIQDMNTLHEEGGHLHFGATLREQLAGDEEPRSPRYATSARREAHAAQSG